MGYVGENLNKVLRDIACRGIVVKRDLDTDDH